MDPSSAPLADYFWIAGLDSASYGEQFNFDPNTGEKIRNDQPTPATSPIAENGISEDDEEGGQRNSYIPTEPAKSDSLGSFQRLSTLSNEARLSIRTVDSTGSPSKVRPSESNRSSTTITGVQINGTNGLGEFDFDNALKKFASERDNFLEELSFTAGAPAPQKPAMNPRAQKIRSEEGGNLGRGGVGGSIRRRISFRDLNSMRRQPSVARACESSCGT
jgi:hypothetical protein